MKIQQLDIENFRGIRDMRIDFHPRLNVFAGMNGVGKTTILNALGNAVGIAFLDDVAGNERQDLESRAMITPRDIRFGADQSRIELRFSLGDKVIHTILSSKREEMPSDMISHFPGAGIKVPCQLFSEDRSTITSTRMPDEKTMNLIGGADPLIGRILSDISRFARTFSWISDREDLENSRLRKFIDGGKEFGKDHFEKDKILHAVKNVIADITGFAGLFNDREKQGFTIKKPLGSMEETLFFSQLSSGEQHLVAFVATIAAFLAETFPEAANPLHGEAVFLVDAIELHLHPSWQREIIPKLLSAFPNCQFVITTHSPLVIGNVKPESVFMLKQTDGEIIYDKPDESYGMTMDRLLEIVMEDESRSAAPIRKQLQRLFEHVSRKEFEEAKDIVNSVKSVIPTDPDLIRAEMILHRKGIGL